MRRIFQNLLQRRRNKTKTLNLTPLAGRKARHEASAKKASRITQKKPKQISSQSIASRMHNKKRK